LGAVLALAVTASGVTPPGASAPDAPAAGGTTPATPEKDPVLLPDDMLVFVRDHQLWCINGEGKGLRQLTKGPTPVSRPTAAPDGSLVAFEMFDDTFHDFALYAVSIDGGQPVPLDAVGHTPCWSPDAGRLLYSGVVRGVYQIFACNRHGKDMYRITDTVSPESLPVWSPDGMRIAFTRDVSMGGQRRTTIVVRDATGRDTEVAMLSGMQVTDLAWAPGAALLISQRTTDNGRVHDELAVLDPDAKKPREVIVTDPLESESFGHWAPSTAGMIYVQTRAGTTHVMMRLPGKPGKAVPGLALSDTEPTILPGKGHRAPQIFAGNRRCFYRPTPLVVGDDVLLPASVLAGQLGWTLTSSKDSFTLTKGATTALISLADATAKVGANTTPLSPAPVTVSGVVMAPVRALTALFGAQSDWNADTRTLRFGGIEANHAIPPGRPPI
jgi:hypothetical protein